MPAFIVATEMPSGARSRGYNIKLRKGETKITEEEKALIWFEGVIKQMRVFAIAGSAVLVLEGEKETMRETI